MEDTQDILDQPEVQQDTNEPIYKTQDGQTVTHTQLLASGYDEGRISKGLQNKVITKIGDTQDPNQTFQTKDGQKVSTSQLIQSGYTQDRIDKGVHNGILSPIEKKNLGVSENSDGKLPSQNTEIPTVGFGKVTGATDNSLLSDVTGNIGLPKDQKEIPQDDITKALTAEENAKAVKEVPITATYGGKETNFGTQKIADVEKIAQAAKLGYGSNDQKAIVDEMKDMPKGYDKIAVRKQDGTVDYPYTNEKLSEERKNDYPTYLSDINNLKTWASLKNSNPQAAQAFENLQHVTSQQQGFYVDANKFENEKQQQEKIIDATLTGDAKDNALKRLDQNKQIIVGKSFDYNSAKDYLDQKLKHEGVVLASTDKTLYDNTAPYNGNIDKYSPDEIGKFINPDNQTEQLIFQKYKKGYDLNNALTHSKDIEDAALQYAAQQNPTIKEQLDKLGGQLPENMKGQIVSSFLDMPDVQSIVSKNPELLAEYNKAKTSLSSKYPEFETNKIATLISQAREDKGMNNWFANIPGQESTDKIVDELVANGKMSEWDKHLYDTKIKPDIGVWQSIGRGIGRTVGGAFIDKSPIHTPGLLENTEDAFNNSIRGVARSLEDVSGGIIPMQPDDNLKDANRLYNTLQENSNMIPFVPKGKLHEISEGTGNLTGFLLPMIAGGAVLNGVKGGELINNALMFEGSNRDRALTEFPNDPIKRGLYTTIGTGIDMSLAEILPIDKIGEGTSKLFKNDIKGVVNDLADGKITEAAAKQTLMDKATQFIPKLVGENAKTSAVITAFGVFHDFLDKAFGANDMSASDIMQKGIQQYKSTFLTTPLIAALSAYGKNNKVNGKILWEIGGNEDVYRKMLDDKLQMNPDSKELKDQSENLNNIVLLRKDLENVRIPEERKQKYMVESLNQSIWERKAKETSDDIIKQKYLDKAEKFREQKEAIYSGKDKADEFKQYDNQKVEEPIKPNTNFTEPVEGVSSDGIPTDDQQPQVKGAEPSENILLSKTENNGKGNKETDQTNGREELLKNNQGTASDNKGAVLSETPPKEETPIVDKEGNITSTNESPQEAKQNEVPNPQEVKGTPNKPPTEISKGTEEPTEEGKVTGVKRSITDEVRGTNSLPKVDIPKMGSDIDALHQAKERVDSGKVNPRDLVSRILDNNEGYRNEDDVMDMQYYAHQLSSKESDLSKQLSEAEIPEDKANIIGKQQQLSDEIDRQTEAAQIAGNKWSRIGNRMQPVIDTGFNISRERNFIKEAYGGEIPQDVKNQIDDISKERDNAIAEKNRIEELLKQKMAKDAMLKIEKDATKSTKRKQVKEELKKEEEELLKELKKSLKKDFGNLNAGIPIPKETLETLGKLAVNYFKQGAVTLDALVDKIYSQIKDDIDGVSKKDVRDFLAEYEPLSINRETERLNKKAEKLESDIVPPTIKTKGGKPSGVSEPTDFNKSSKIQKTYRNNTDWVKANQRVYNAEYKIKILKRKAFENTKNFYQKGLMWAGRLTRLSILSGYNVLYKLSAATTIGGAGKRIAEQAIGAIYSQIFSRMANKAPIEGLTNWSNVVSEAKFYKEFFNPKKFARNSWEILKTGSSDLTKKMTAGEYEHVPGLYLPTDLHQIIKDPVKRATFEASFRNSMIWAEKQGLDINDPLVINSLENNAYKRANYEIFQEQNWLSKKLTSYKSALETKGVSGDKNIGATAKFLIDFMIPVSTVPTNMVRRLVSTSPLGLIKGSAETINAYRKGISSLSPDEADKVMRHLKQGTLGTALWLTGWYAASHFGGLYSQFNPNKKRMEGELPSDQMEVNGEMIPKPIQHALPLEIMQLAATSRHIYDNYVSKGKSTPESVYNAALGSIGALVEQIPVLETGAHLIGAATSPYEAEKLKEDIKRRVQPTILKETGVIPKDEKKKPETTSNYHN